MTKPAQSVLRWSKLQLENQEQSPYCSETEMKRQRSHFRHLCVQTRTAVRQHARLRLRSSQPAVARSQKKMPSWQLASGSSFFGHIRCSETWPLSLVRQEPELSWLGLGLGLGGLG